MADTVKRGVLLKGLAHLAEMQKHVMKDSARLNSYAQMRAEVVDRSSSCGSRALYAHGCRRSLHERPQGEGKTKGKGKPDDQKG